MMTCLYDWNSREFFATPTLSSSFTIVGNLSFWDTCMPIFISILAGFISCLSFGFILLFLVTFTGVTGRLLYAKIWKSRNTRKRSRQAAAKVEQTALEEALALTHLDHTRISTRTTKELNCECGWHRMSREKLDPNLRADHSSLLLHTTNKGDGNSEKRRILRIYKQNSFLMIQRPAWVHSAHNDGRTDQVSLQRRFQSYRPTPYMTRQPVSRLTINTRLRKIARNQNVSTCTTENNGSFIFSSHYVYDNYSWSISSPRIGLSWCCRETNGRQFTTNQRRERNDWNWRQKFFNGELWRYVAATTTKHIARGSTCPCNDRKC